METKEILQQLVEQTGRLSEIETTLSTLLILLFGFFATYILLKWRNR